MTGREALEEAAQLELTRIYGRVRPEFRRTPEMVAADVLHYGLVLGWSTRRIALKVRIKQAEVTRILVGVA